MKFKRELSAEELPKGNGDEITKKAKGRSPEGKSRSTEEESSSGSDGSYRRSSESEKEANKDEKQVKKRPSKDRMLLLRTTAALNTIDLRTRTTSWSSSYRKLG